MAVCFSIYFLFVENKSADLGVSCWGVRVKWSVRWTDRWELRQQSTMYWLVVKRELSWRAKLPIYQSVDIPNLTCGHELWVESWMQAAEMSFLRQGPGLIFSDRVKSSDIWIELAAPSRWWEKLEVVQISGAHVCLHGGGTKTWLATPSAIPLSLNMIGFLPSKRRDLSFEATVWRLLF